MRKFILGSDWWTDCDDAVAVRLLGNFHRQGIIDLKAIALSACMPYSVPSLDAFLQVMGIRIPLGIDLEGTDFGGSPSYQKRLTSLPYPQRSNEEAENPVRLYRRILAGNDAVELLEIGFPQILAALLKSPADDLSPLSGVELVRAKVPCLWIMAGKWDEPGARENNFRRNRRASEAASYLCANWPGKMVFLGFEVGESVQTGGKLPADDPLKQVLIDHGSANGRSSWDPMLALLAVTGDIAEAGYEAVYGKAAVEAADGSNYFAVNASGKHCFVRKMRPDAWYADEINRRIGL